MMNNEFEKSFADFIDGTAYDKASDALFMVVRSAYLAGWVAAGGKEPQMQKVLTKIFTVLNSEDD